MLTIAEYIIFLFILVLFDLYSKSSKGGACTVFIGDPNIKRNVNIINFSFVPDPLQFLERRIVENKFQRFSVKGRNVWKNFEVGHNSVKRQKIFSINGNFLSVSSLNRTYTYYVGRFGKLSHNDIARKRTRGSFNHTVQFCPGRLSHIAGASRQTIRR